MEGSHSPFGILWQIASATGWSLRHIMWKVNYQTLLLMAADAPRYVTGKSKKNNGGIEGFFKTKLKEQNETS